MERADGKARFQPRRGGQGRADQRPAGWPAPGRPGRGGGAARGRVNGRAGPAARAGATCPRVRGVRGLRAPRGGDGCAGGRPGRLAPRDKGPGGVPYRLPGVPLKIRAALLVAGEALTAISSNFVTRAAPIGERLVAPWSIS